MYTHFRKSVVVFSILLLSSTIGHYDTYYNEENDCNRPCEEGYFRTCHYKFTVEKFYAMSKACFDCPRDSEDCYREDCVAVDGIPRSITTVNRRIPGPRIEVCLGDEIVVEVENTMDGETTSIHWHGLHQIWTPYMDGVPFVSQCPINPLSVFRYTMYADNGGTHFWHAHTGVQRADGVFGALVVKVPDSKNFHKDLYDEDLSEHTIIVNDWSHKPNMDNYLSHLLGWGKTQWDVLLINGRGRFYQDTEEKTATPLAVFKVQKGRRYRFRLINAGVMSCPVEMYIDKHNVTFISSDGQDFDPVVADSLVSYPGERWDFVLNADQEEGNYWIRFSGLLDCDNELTNAHQVAVLRYEGAPEREPEERVGHGLHPQHTLQLNSFNVKRDEPNTMSVPALMSANKTRDEELLDDEPETRIFLPFDLNQVDHPIYHKPRVYGFDQVHSTFETPTPQFNHTSFKWPYSPLMSQHEDIPEDFFCNPKLLSDCNIRFCQCTNVVEIRLNSVVELVLINEGKVYYTSHAFHLHGHPFRVLAMDRVGDSTEEHIVRQLYESGQIVRNLENPPYKDTVTVPDGGYTILRFRANNPGYWLFHCHIELHLKQGMALVFKVGEHEDFLQIPDGFPRCGDFPVGATLN